MMPWGVDHSNRIMMSGTNKGCEVTYDAVRRWSPSGKMLRDFTSFGEVTYDAVRRWSQDKKIDAVEIPLREVTYDAVRRWSLLFISQNGDITLVK